MPTNSLVAEQRPAPNARAFVALLRLNRSPMVAIVAGTAAFAAGVGAGRALWMTLAGFCLAVGGFSLDLYADRDLDAAGPRAARRHNPFAAGALAPAAGLAFSGAFILVSLALLVALFPAALLPWVAILAVIVGLALHAFETPLARALTLGALQALYALMGGMAGRLSGGLALFAAVLFFAMFGGRGMIDVRDFAQDQATRLPTMPQRYGLRRTAQFTAVCLVVSCALSLAAYWVGPFNRIYLYLDLLFIAVGLACAGLFVARPTPRRAHILTNICMVGEGLLICLAVVLGSLAL